MGETPQDEKELNTISDIRKWFEKDARPYAQGEFIEFWKSLSDEDKLEFQKADLS